MAKHNWILDESGKPDEWAWESGFHSGVICQDCGFSPCVLCDEDWFEMDDCPGPRVRKPQTNADRIRAMSDEELAKFLLNFFVEHMDINGTPHEEVTAADKLELLRQLQQPVEEAAHDR